MSTPPSAATAGAHRGRSILTPGQHTLLRVVLCLSTFMLVDSLFLSSVRLLDLHPSLAAPRGTLPAFYQAMILLHIFGGWLLLPPALAFALWHLTRVWKRHHGSAVWTGLLVLACAFLLAFSGPYIQTQASSREHRGMFWAHVSAAGVVVLAYTAHRLVSAYRPTARAFRRAAATIGLLLVASLTAHLATLPSGSPLPPAASTAGPPGRPVGDGAAGGESAGSHDAFLPFRALGDVPADRLFFPAAATTTTLGLLPAQVLTNGDLPDPAVLAEDMERSGFLHREAVGAQTCVRCHPDVVEQWSRSAHRFSSFNNPFYRKTIETMREKEGFTRSKWCSSCHDPVLMLPGDMDRPIDPAGAHAQAGLTCLSCHQIDRLHNLTGNGAYNIPDTEPEPYLFSQSKGEVGRTLHDMIVKARPEVHKAQMLKPFFRTSEFCSVCHKVSLDVPVNEYRWLRGQNEYDNWHDSGVNHSAARTFYLPPQRKVCQDCHMPLEPAVLGDVSAKGGMVRSHRFLAVNTALPHLRGDRETIERTEAFLRDAKLRVDVFAARVPSAPAEGAGPSADRAVAPAEGAVAPAEGAGAEREDSRTVMGLDRARPTLPAGQPVEFHVVVRNLGVGHTFPGGTNDSNEGWIDFQVLDGSGKPLYRSGALESSGHLEPRAHKYHVIMVDRNSDPVHNRIPSGFRAMVYGRTIGPSTSDLGRYRVNIPAELAGREVEVRAELRWRKFDRSYTEFVFAGKEVPELPVTTIASASVRLAVGTGVEAGTGAAAALAREGPGGGEAAPDGENEWTRYNDYGIGLLLQGDTRAAVKAFEEVEQRAPGRPDGPRNLARVALADGDLPGAMEHLRRCEKVAPGDYQTAFFWGEVLQKSGLYDQAFKAYRRVLERFPQDRQALFQMGRTLYLHGKYREALEQFLRVLEIDPEQREAHYHRFLCYRGLGDAQAAAEAEKAYLKYQIDESAQEFTRNFRLKYPEANFEAQRIHVHE